MGDRLGIPSVVSFLSLFFRAIKYFNRDLSINS
jgi:basic membrane lipoprotein Med (substrate-binding protein (PBP1-ABC) superfamily)